MMHNMAGFIEQVVFVGSGIVVTLELLVGGIVIGLLLGTLFAIARYSGVCVGIINCLISIIRGTPLILQLSFVYFLVPVLLGISLSIVASGMITFGINSSVYIAEILRAGIAHLPKGQFEAAKTLQIPTFYVWRDIVFPQVLRNILPALINEIITVSKDTALIATLGGMDIMRKMQILAAQQFTYFMPLCIAALYYYCLVLLLEHIGKKIEKRGQYVKN